MHRAGFDATSVLLRSGPVRDLFTRGPAEAGLGIVSVPLSLSFPSSIFPSEAVNRIVALEAYNFIQHVQRRQKVGLSYARWPLATAHISIAKVFQGAAHSEALAKECSDFPLACLCAPAITRFAKTLPLYHIPQGFDKFLPICYYCNVLELTRNV